MNPISDDIADFNDRREREQRRYYARRPKKISDVLAKLITLRGYGRFQADAELAATRATYEKTKTTYEQTEKSAQAKINAARAELEEALARAPIKSNEEKLELARQLAAQTVIKAPVSGTVLKVVGREGQPTGVEPIIQMGDLSQMVAVAEVYESDVGQLATWVRSGECSTRFYSSWMLPSPIAWWWRPRICCRCSTRRCFGGSTLCCATTCPTRMRQRRCSRTD